MDDDCPIIPFEGEYLGITNPNQAAPWIKDEDRIPLILAVSIYGNPVRVIESFEMVDNTYQTRYAAWIDKSTRLLIVACRGTSVGLSGGMKDLKDDTVSFYLLSSNALTLLHKSTIIVHNPSFQLYPSLIISSKDFKTVLFSSIFCLGKRYLLLQQGRSLLFYFRMVLFFT